MGATEEYSVLCPWMMVGSPVLLLIAAVAAIACATVARRRLPIAIFLAAAIFAGLAAAADIRIFLRRAPIVAVLIDASPSTRGFWFRDATEARRVAAHIADSLAPGATLKFSTFADGDPTTTDGAIAEQAVDRTTLSRIDADAVLLLSDGRLVVSKSVRAPIYPIIGRENPTGDARLLAAEIDGDRLVVALANDGPRRTLTWPDGTTTVVPPGTMRLSHAAPTDRGNVHLDAGDRWPENDSIEIAPAVQIASERWWIGAMPAPAGYRAIAPNALPLADAWLAARQVVIDNVPANAISAEGMRSISHYVRDLGGSLMIVGGDRAFSAGGYGGTELDALSPLASRPPEPRREWLVLIDASGSMATKADDGRSRLEAAIEAASALVAALPAADSVGVASFAKDLRTWPARENRRVIAPADLVASGPTNLAAALKSILFTRHSGSDVRPLRVILLTDGDADMSTFAPPAGMAKEDGTMTIDWLRLSTDNTHQPLADIVEATGGSIISAGESSQWRSRAVAAVRAAEVVPAAAVPTSVRWRGPLADLGVVEAARANETYLRGDAEVLASRSGLDDASRSPIVARWRAGEGQVIAIAFAALPSLIDRAAELIASSPRDPRFAVAWDSERVTVDAGEGGSPLNDLAIDVREIDGVGGSILFTQTAPGRYAATVPADSSARTMVTRVAGRRIDLHVVAGAPVDEFRATGTDRAALERLAADTGGRVIDRDRPEGPQIVARREWSIAAPLLLTSMIATAAAVLVRRL
jgi:hypothetical protein